MYNTANNFGWYIFFNTSDTVASVGLVGSSAIDRMTCGKLYIFCTQIQCQHLSSAISFSRISFHSAHSICWDVCFKLIGGGFGKMFYFRIRDKRQVISRRLRDGKCNALLGWYYIHLGRVYFKAKFDFRMLPSVTYFFQKFVLSKQS